MKNLLFACLCLSLLGVSGCASMTGMEEGRTLGQNNSEFGVSMNFINASDIFEDEDIEEDLGNIFFPSIELAYKYGITDDLDLGGRFTTNLNFNVFMKYQFIKDRTNNIGLAAGLDIGSVAIVGYSLQVPLYLSIYASPNFAINISPRYSYIYAGVDIGTGYSTFGGNVGFLLGKRHKFGLDFGYHGGSFEDNSLKFLNVGIGGKFRFGDYSSADSGNNDRRRR